MRVRLPTARAPWFLAERLLSQIGGLVLVAGMARLAPPETTAAFIAAYALASLVQPLLANACQPVLIRLIQGGRVAEARGLFGGLVLLAALIATLAIGVSLLAGSGLIAAVFVPIVFAPLVLASAPLITADRWRAVLSVTIPASAVGITARLLVLFMGGDLMLVAMLFAFEPLIGGVGLMRRAGFRPTFAMPRADVVSEAAPLVAAMGASSLFWRSPVLIASLMLAPVEVLHLAFAMQLVTGMLLLPNALIQSLIGLLAGADGVRRSALSAGGAAAVICGAGAVFGAVMFGQPMLTLVYGDVAAGAAQVLVALSPLVGFGMIWRLVEVSTALLGLSRALILTRFIALIGQTGAVLLAVFWPGAVVLAVMTSVSLGFAAMMVPALMPSLREIRHSILAGALSVFSRRGLLTTRLVFARN